MTCPAYSGPSRQALTIGVFALTLAAGCVGDFDPEKYFAAPEPDASLTDGGAEGGADGGMTSSNMGGGRDARAGDPADAGEQQPVEPSDEDAATEPVDNVDPLSQQGWAASASAQSELAYLAVDGDASTRWSTGAVMVGGEWFQVDLGRSLRFGGLVIDAADSADDFPVGYRVYASDDPGSWGPAIAEGSGNGSLTTIEFDTQTARHLRIEQTGTSDVSWWSIHELTLQAP